MTTTVVSIGSDLGDRLAHLRLAVDALRALGPVRVSSVWETDPVGSPAGTPDFLNAVVLVDAEVGPVMAVGQAAEAAAARTREVRRGARTLDVDVVASGALVRADPALTVPHPRAHERAFVLAPWADLDPDAELVGHGRVADLLTGLSLAGLRRTGLVL